MREHRKRQTAVQGAEDLIERARRTLPVASLDIVEEGIRRLTSYQDRRYATLYLDRLDTIHALGSGELLREVARHLAVRMSFEDVIRVAQAKTSAERMMRVRAEVRAKDHEPLAITEHFKPGIEEIAAVLPPSIAKRLLGWGERTGRLGKTYFSMQVRTTTILGFARLRLVAGLRWWRPRTSRYVEEQAEIERWLGQIRAASPLGVDLAREIAESARLIKGYGDTHKRGLGNYRRIADEVIAPALAGRLTPRAAADAVANARVAALADPGRRIAVPNADRHRRRNIAAQAGRGMSNKSEPAVIDVAALARRDEFCTSLGIQFVEASLGRAVTRVTIEQRHLNFNGVGHGGLTFTLADAAFGFACNSQGVVSGSIDAHILYSVAVATGRCADRHSGRNLALQQGLELSHRRRPRRRQARRRDDRYRPDQRQAGGGLKAPSSFDCAARRAAQSKDLFSGARRVEAKRGPSTTLRSAQDDGVLLKPRPSGYPPSSRRP